VNAILLFDDGGRDEPLALDAVFGGAGRTRPVGVFDVVLVGHELVDHAVGLLYPLERPAFDDRTHGRSDP